MQEQRGRQICPVRQSGHHEIFPGVGSRLPGRPISWILNSGKGRTNPSQDIRQRDPTQRISEGRSRIAREAQPNQTGVVMGQEKPLLVF
jgi:hypothetical protein